MVEEMLDPIFLEDLNKLSPLISFKNILMTPKNKFKRMLHPGFLEFQEFQRPHHRLFLLQNQKLLRMIKPQRISLKIILMEIKMRTLVLLQLQQLKQLLQKLLLTKLQIFFKTSTNNF